MKHLSFVLLLTLVYSSCSRETKRMDDYAVQGIDISHHQKKIDWKLVASQGIDFAFVKATEGSEHQDTMFQQFWKAIKAAGIKRGAYHFFSPFSSAKGQAQHFIETVTLEKGDLPPVLDVEITGKLQNQTLRENTLIWLRAIEKHYGIKPIIYTNQKFYLSHFTGDEFDGYPIWMARYNSPNNPPFIPFGRQWTFWQYGDCGHMDGIKGCVDFNVFRGERQQFENLLYHSAYRDSLDAQNKPL